MRDRTASRLIHKKLRGMQEVTHGHFDSHNPTSPQQTDPIAHLTLDSEIY
jgi:hypothetical protein